MRRKSENHDFVEADGEVDLVDVEAAEVEDDLNLSAVSGADYTAAEATAEVSLKTGAGFDVAVAITEDVSELIDLRTEIDSVANPEATSDTRFKKVRKAEAMETAVSGSGEMQSRAIRSDEARRRKNAKDNQRQRARKASTKSSHNMTETDSAQEAKETEGAGK